MLFRSSSISAPWREDGGGASTASLSVFKVDRAYRGIDSQGVYVYVLCTGVISGRMERRHVECVTEINGDDDERNGHHRCACRVRPVV